MKRGKIQLTGSTPIMRISAPGYDVDTAPDHGFLLHENHLYSQPFFWELIPKPASGNIVTVTIPNVGNTPNAIVFPIDSEWQVSFPYTRSKGSGSNETQWFGLETWMVTHRFLSNTSMEVLMSNSHASDRSGNGAYFLLMRTPT